MPQCPKCSSTYPYPDGHLWICPECSHEWTIEGPTSPEEAETEETSEVKDANGNILANGDSVVVMKDLKIKGASSNIKSGTKVRNIRLITPVDGHNIACKIDGVGSVNLKSEFVKKV